MPKDTKCEMAPGLHLVLTGYVTNKQWDVMALYGTLRQALSLPELSLYQRDRQQEGEEKLK